MSEQEPRPEELRAAEYVLGTLDADARAEIDAALARGDSDTLREVGWWEQRLGRLALALKPVEPPAGAWNRILQTAGLQNPGPVQAGPTAPRRGRSRFWPALAMAATLAAVALAGMLVTGLPGRIEPPAASDQAPRFASIIRDADSGAGWLVTAYPDQGKLQVVALRGYPVADQKSLELWLLPPGGAPLSVGLLPQQGSASMSLPVSAAASLTADAKLAVSLEPAGGSPTGAPTGAVLWVAPLTGGTE